MIHNLPTCRLLTVDVPEGAVNFKLFNGEKPYVSFFNYTNNVVSTGRVYHVPPGNWELLGRFEEITEEKRKVVGLDTEQARSLIAGNPVVLIERKKDDEKDIS